MKKKVSIFAVLTFTITLLLNLTLDSNGVGLLSSVNSQVPPTTELGKSAQVGNCTDENGDVYAYYTECGDGTGKCVATLCPDPPLQ